MQRTARTLIERIEHPQSARPVYRKLPLILGGEQSVSLDEPVRTINQFMDQLEQDPRILSLSLIHIYPHGNLKQDYVESIQILRSYRQSPHTDKEETYETVSYTHLIPAAAFSFPRFFPCLR